MLTPMQIWDRLRQPGYVRSLVAMLGGTLFAKVALSLIHILQLYLHHSVMDKGQPPSASSPALLLFWRAGDALLLAATWPGVVLVFLYLVWRTIQLRHQKEGGMAAFFAGLMLVFVVQKLVQSIWG